jgi:hypothetical protein
MPIALIRFTQGATTAPAGTAVLGATGSAVVASNGQDTPDIASWTWALVSAPTASALPTGISSSGAVRTYTFTPDVTGCYVVHLVTEDVAGNLAEDYRVFGVVETSGRLIPSFRGTDLSMNFAAQTRGWDPYLEAYLKQIDALSAGTGVQPFRLPGRDVSASTAWNPASDYELRLKAIGGAITITFPGSPTTGHRYAATDCDATAPGNVTISGGGHNVANDDGVSAPAATLAWPAAKYQSFEFEFTGTIWSIV